MRFTLAVLLTASLFVPGVSAEPGELGGSPASPAAGQMPVKNLQVQSNSNGAGFSVTGPGYSQTFLNVELPSQHHNYGSPQNPIPLGGGAYQYGPNSTIICSGNPTQAIMAVANV